MCQSFWYFSKTYESILWSDWNVFKDFLIVPLLMTIEDSLEAWQKHQLNISHNKLDYEAAHYKKMKILELTPVESVGKKAILWAQLFFSKTFPKSGFVR